MKERIDDILCGREGNYVYSFVELHPDMALEEVRQKIEELYRSGIKTVVFEYSMGLGNGFAGFTQHWYEILRDLTALLKSLGMSFYIQDAAPFPTGAANGWFKKEPYRKYRKIYLAEGHMDVGGPRPGGCFLAEDFLNDKIYEYIPNPCLEQEDELKYVVAVKKDQNGELIPGTAIDLTGNVTDGRLQWDVPEGRYRIFFIFTTRNGGISDYMNLLDKKSVEVLIESVYEAHFRKIKDAAGKTWLGFFYDEPEVGNLKKHDFYAKLGKRYMPLPWCDELETVLKLLFGNAFALWLPFLWYGAEDSIAGKVRYEYMNAVTRMIQENYSHQMYAWCQAHGLLYIGHVLEDENSHGRLGCGCGHFFRVQKYQHMAGVDVISEQLIPGADSNNESNGCHWAADGEFYHYGLAKLASSNACLNPAMDGQSFCEVLALYGMIAGPKYRKYIFDHMVTAGINHFIVMQGSHESNPLFPFGNALYAPYFTLLYKYVNRLCHLMSKGRRSVRAALLYHAEAEWGGKAMLFQKPARILAQNQIDYDVVPGDWLLEGRVFDAGEVKELRVHRARYRVLVVPESYRLPCNMMYKLRDFYHQGFPVIFINSFPEDYSDFQYAQYSGNKVCGQKGLSVLRPGETVALNDLAWWIIKRRELQDICVLPACPQLRYCLVRDKDGECLLLHNQAEFQTLETTLVLPETWEEKSQIFSMNLIRGDIVPFGENIQRNGENRLECQLRLTQWEALVLVYYFDKESAAVLRNNGTADRNPEKTLEINGPWQLTFIPYVETGIKYDPVYMPEPEDISLIPGYENFSGEITYTACFECADAGIACFCEKSLLLEQVYESVSVWLNGKKLGSTFAAPYVFPVPAGIVKECNVLTIKIQNSMARGLKDGFIRSSKYVPLEPSGLCGKVKLIYTLGN